MSATADINQHLFYNCFIRTKTVFSWQLVLHVKLKSESSWISVCPPKYQLFIEVFIDKSALLEVNASHLGILCLAVWAARAQQSKAGCFFAEWEKLWVVVCEVFWPRTSAVPGSWPQLCPFLPPLMATHPWTSFSDNSVLLECWGAGACFVSVPICWEMLRSTWDEISRSSHGCL